MNDKDDSLLTPEHIKAIARFIVGGGLVGAGVGGVGALTQYLKRLGKDAREEDDDVMYVYRDPGVKSANAPDAFHDPVGATGAALGNVTTSATKGVVDVFKQLAKGLAEGSSDALNDAKSLVADPTAAGLATTAALISALGGYSLVRKLYAKYDKNKAQEELDSAQRAYLSEQGYKEASVKGDSYQPSGLDFVGGAAVAIPLITLLSAAVATNTYLDMQYPKQKKMPKGPRRVEIINTPAPPIENPDGDVTLKQACATELALHMIDAAGSETSDVRNLITSIARDGVTEFKKAASAMGFFQAVDLTKGASASDTDDAARLMAITYLAHSPSTSAQVGVMAAGELAESYPSIYKTACALDSDKQDALLGVASVLGASIRAERGISLGLATGDLAKEAAAQDNAMPTDATEKWLNINAKNSRPATRGDADESTGTSGEEAGIADPDSPSRAHSSKQLLMTGKTGRTHLDSNKLDAIDRFLSATKEKPAPTPKETGKSGFISPIV